MENGEDEDGGYRQHALSSYRRWRRALSEAGGSAERPATTAAMADGDAGGAGRP